MKASLLKKPKEIQIEEVDLVLPQDRDLLVKVKMAGICGSDFHRYTGERPVSYYPMTLGHEFVGIVEQIGPCVKNFKPGDRIVAKPYVSCGECYFCTSGLPQLCQKRLSIGIHRPGCFAEYTTIPEKSAILVPGHVPDEAAVMVEPLAIALRIIRKAKSIIGKKIVILGAGAIGLLALILAKQAGAKVIVSDIFQDKLQLASELGADITVNVTQKDLIEEVQNWSLGLGADLAIETAGVSKTVEQAIKAVRPAGKVILAGLSTELSKISSIDIARKEIKIEGTVYYVEEFAQAVSLAPEHNNSLKKIITHRFDLLNTQEAFEVIEQKKAIKVLLVLK